MQLRSRGRACVNARAALVMWCSPVPAADTPSWLDPKLAEAAKKEGTLVIYSSVNETEGLAILKKFVQATGIKIEYIRGSDS